MYDIVVLSVIGNSTYILYITFVKLKKEYNKYNNKHVGRRSILTIITGITIQMQQRWELGTLERNTRALVH